MWGGLDGGLASARAQHQDLLAEVAGRRREANDTAARILDLARARRAAVLAARVMGVEYHTL